MIVIKLDPKEGYEVKKSSLEDYLALADLVDKGKLLKSKYEQWAIMYAYERVHTKKNARALKIKDEITKALPTSNYRFNLDLTLKVNPNLLITVEGVPIYDIDTKTVYLLGNTKLLGYEYKLTPNATLELKELLLESSNEDIEINEVKELIKTLKKGYIIKGV